MDTVILCGGKGMRAYPHTLELPKPLMEVDGTPVLQHVMAIYAEQGHQRFLLSAGFKANLITEFAAGLPAAWDITVRDTGEETGTGGRVHALRHEVSSTFFTTYGDGLGNIDLEALARFHASHGGAATVTTVPLPSQYGTIDIAPGGRVERFREKPRLPDHRINAGFFVFDRRVFDLWDGDDLEREVLPALAAKGELFAFAHDGFWKSLDTYKDAVELSELCHEGHVPWMQRSS